MKGARVKEEVPRALRAIRQLGGGDAILHQAPLPGAEEHVIVEIPKNRPTPNRFPRPTADARRHPI